MGYGYYYVLDAMKLQILCNEVCSIKNKTAVYNTLRRGRIDNTDILRIIDLDKVKEHFRTIGDKRLEFIKQMVDICNDREKFEEILSRNDDYNKLDASKNLFDLVIDLYSNHDCSDSEIAKMTGLSKDTVRMIIWL